MANFLDTPRRSNRTHSDLNYKTFNSTGHQRLPNISEMERENSDEEQLVDATDILPGGSQEGASLADSMNELSVEEIKALILKHQEEAADLAKRKDKSDLMRQLQDLQAGNATTREEIKNNELQAAVTRGQGSNVKVRSKNKVGTRSTQKSNVFAGNVDITSLRQDPQLSQRADSILASLGLGQEDVDSDEEDLVQSITSKGKHRVSGLFAEANDCVKRHVIWPQEKLGPKYVNYASGKVKYRSLDLRLLACGEIELILSNDINSQEKHHRLVLLKDLLFNANYYEWQAVLRLHAAILSEVESGCREWGDDISKLESQILLPYPVRKAGITNPSSSSTNGKPKERGGQKEVRKSDGEKAWFCSAYNKNTCSFREPHTTEWNGRTMVVQHICAKCYQEKKVKAFHPESSNECPLSANDQ